MQTKYKGIYWAFLAPALILYLSIFAFPVFASLGLSFVNFNIFKFSFDWIGFKNFTRILTDASFWRAFNNNIFVVAISIFGQIPLGLVLAYILYRKIIKRTAFFQSMVFLPMVISTVVIGILWNRILVQPTNGLLITFLRWFFENPSYSLSQSTNALLAMFPIGIALIWVYTGFYMLVFAANLQKIDESMIEAAQIDGATNLQIFFKLIVPNLSGVIVTNIILSISGSLKGFDLIWVMTQGGPAGLTEVLPIYMYKNTFGIAGDYDYGSAISTIIVLISMVLIILTRVINKFFNNDDLA